MGERTGASVATWLRADPRRFDVLVATVTVGGGTALMLSAPDRFDTGWPDVVAGVGAFVLLVMRRHRPWLLLGIALAWAALHVGILGRPTVMLFACLVLLATVWPRAST